MSKKGAFFQTTILILSALFVMVAMCPGASAAADTVNLQDAINNDLTVITNGTIVMIKVNDGTTDGTTVAMSTATVEEQGVPANSISVDIYDNGAIIWDTANDGTYVGMFNVTDAGTGGLTDDPTDFIAVAHDKTIVVDANLDGDASGGTDSVTTDFEAPAVAITSLDEAFVSGNYYLTITATDPNMGNVTYQVASGDETETDDLGGGNYMAIVNGSLLPEERHEIKVTAKDNATNAAYDYINITIDRSEPTVAIHPAKSFVTDEFKLNVTISDFNLNKTTVSYRLDGGSWEPLPEIGLETFAKNVDVSGEAEGSHAISISAGDLAENFNTTQTVAFTIDRTAAVIEVLTEEGMVVKDSFKLQVNVTEENLGASPDVKYSIDGALGVKMDKPVDVFEAIINTIPLTEGAHQIEVTVVDLASNSETSDPFNFIVDRTDPVITVTSATSGFFPDKYTISAEVVDTNLDPAKVVYKIDAQSFLPLNHTSGDSYSTTLDTSKWAEKSGDPYIITLKATDKAGNFNETAEISIIVDKTAPTVSYSFKWTAQGYRLEVVLNDLYLDPNSPYYMIDGGAARDFDNIVSNTYTAIIPATQFPEGNHTITIYAKDQSGNEKLADFPEVIAVPPPQVTGLVATDMRDGKIKLTWDKSPVSDIDHYDIYYKPVSIFTNVEGLTATGTSTMNSTDIQGLIVGERYYFAVVAVDELGNYNTSVHPISAISTKTPEVPELEITNIDLDNDKPVDGDMVTVEVTVKNTGPYDATNLKVRLMDNNNPDNYATISSLKSGEEATRTIDWLASEGDHNLSVEVLSGVSPLTTKDYPSKVTVKEQKTTVQTTPWWEENMMLILILVAAIVVGILIAAAFRGSKKEEEDLIKQEIELGLRPDKDGKIRKPEEMKQPEPKPGEQPVKPPPRSPEVDIPQSPLLQQKPPEQPPPAAPPQQPPPQAPPQQPPPQAPPQQPLPQAPPQQQKWGPPQQ